MDRDTFIGLMMLAAVAPGGAVISNPFLAGAIVIGTGVAIIELGRLLPRFTNKG